MLLSSGSIRPGLESWDRELVHILKIEILIGIIVDLHTCTVGHTEGSLVHFAQVCPMAAFCETTV